MALAEKYLPKYSIKDYESWEGRWELIEGVPYALASPSFQHQRTVIKIARFLDEYLEENCPNCRVGIDTDYIIDSHTVVRPDVFITCEEVRDRLLKAPAVIFEVVSEGTLEKDEGLKMELYAREKVGYYVLIYPELKKAKVYILEGESYRKLTDAVDETVTFTVADCTVPLDFSKVFT